MVSTWGVAPGFILYAPAARVAYTGMNVAHTDLRVAHTSLRAAYTSLRVAYAGLHTVILALALTIHRSYNQRFYFFTLSLFHAGSHL